MLIALKKRIAGIPRPNLFLTGVLAVAFFMTYLIFWVLLQRAFCLNLMIAEIKKIQNSLLEVGMDIAYDKAEFSKLSPFSLIKFDNFKIYSLNAQNYWEWNIPELKINSSLFDCGHLTISTNRNQEFVLKTKSYPVEIPVLKIALDFNKEIGLKEISIEGMALNIQGLATIDSLKFASQRMAPMQVSELTPLFENHFEIKKLTISEEIKFPLIKEINRIYLNANIIGVLSDKETYSQSVDTWLRLGGIIDIRKLIIDWKPLLMLGRGDLYFNDKLEPNLHLNTSSKGLVNVLDKLQDNILDRKGVFVAKILLNNKSFKLNKTDEYFTVTTPININYDQMLIENIPVKNLNPLKVLQKK